MSRFLRILERFHSSGTGPARPAQDSGPGFPRLFRLLPVLGGILLIAIAAGLIVDVMGSPRKAATAGPAPSASGHLVPAQPVPSQSPGASPRATAARQPRRPAKPVASAQPVVVSVPSAHPAGSAKRTAAGPVELSLTHFLDNVGAVSDSVPTTGNLDGSGSASSAQALAAAGARPGAGITYQGVSFTWPAAAGGKPDNVTASGQSLPGDGAGRTLAFLVTAAWGPAKGTGMVVYAHGPAQKFALGVLDWWTGCASAKATDVVVCTTYRNQGNGRATFQSCVYFASVRLRAGVTVRKIILPDLSAAKPKLGGEAMRPARRVRSRLRPDRRRSGR